MSAGAQHPSDERLSALVDGSLLESDARALRQHLDECGPCHGRLESFESVVRELRALPSEDDSLIPETIQRMRQSPRAVVPRWTLAPAAMIPAAAALLFYLWPSGAHDPELVARGPGEPPRPSVQLEVYQYDPATSRSRQLSGGERLPAAQATLAVAIRYLPDIERHAAVYARDAGGRITWLAPTWSSAGSSPTCLVLPPSAGSIPVSSAVTLEEVAAGALEVVLLVFDKPCSVPDLDARLEGGLRTTVGAVPGLRIASTRVVEIGDAK